jgi:glycosyltransferase involved in cell wall biosynthesis
MNPAMKILLVSPIPTHPTTAGNRARVLALAQALNGLGHEVDFAWITMESGDEAAMQAFFGRRFYRLDYRSTFAASGAIPRTLRWLRRLADRESAYVWKVDDWCHPDIADALCALDRAHAYDAVVVEYVFFSRVLEAFPSRILKIIDANDRFADRHLVYRRAGKQPDWFSTTADEECKGLNRADVVLWLRDEETLTHARLPGARSRGVTVSHLLDVSQRHADPGSHRAVFVGSENSVNAEAVSYVVDEALPLIKQKIPDFELVLAGNICFAVPDAPNVRKLGRVAHVEDAYACGSVAINPVRMGTGINIKALECLALGVPLVCSETGSRGMEALRGRALVCVPDDDACAFSEAIVHLLADASARADYAKASRVAACEWNRQQTHNLQCALARSWESVGVE